MHVCTQMCMCVCPCVSCMSNLYVSLFSVIDSFRRDQAAIQRHIKFARFHYTPQFVSLTALCSCCCFFSFLFFFSTATAAAANSKNNNSKRNGNKNWSCDCRVVCGVPLHSALLCSARTVSLSLSCICAVVRGHENGNSAQSASALSVAVDVTSMRTQYIYM